MKMNFVYIENKESSYSFSFLLFIGIHIRESDINFCCVCRPIGKIPE